MICVSFKTRKELGFVISRFFTGGALKRVP